MIQPLLCTRCGDHIDAEDTRELLDRTFCADCFAKPGVNFLAEFKLKHWRKRDGFVWLFGGFGLFFASLTLFGVTLQIYQRGFRGDDGLVIALTAPHLLLSIATLALWRPARLGWILYYGALCGMGLVDALVRDGTRELIGIMIPFAIVMLFPIAAYFSKQNRLAYGIDISHEDLIKLYANVADNRWAQTGLLLGVLSMIPGCGFVALLSLPLSIVGLTRVDEDAWPPVGLRGRAVAGITCSLLGLAITLLVILVG